MEVNRDTSGSTGQLSSAGSTGGGMHHSHSTPAGVDGGARTPPATPKKGGKMLAIRVQMLDDTITIFQVQAKAMGKVLFEQVCKQLHLLEADYFGLEYTDLAGTRYWLDLQKPISRQLGLSLVDPLLYFCVKFYTPDPAQLEEEYTRYLFCLQVKRDLAQGLMQCNDNTAALMASYIVQAECGDYVSEDYPDHTYLSSYKFVPHQDQEMERRIMENHKKHAGQSPAEADLNLLETARRCELYGIKMHPAKDHENVALNLAVAHMGIVVFQHYSKINTFSWAKIRKISFKRKRFLIKLHPEGYGYYKDTVEFFFEGRNECKNFWKKCVENHGFFRCSSVKSVSRHKTRVLSRGSSFRYSGKTQKQIVEFVRDNYVKRQTFQRSASFRHSSAHSSATNMHTSTVGNSISAHPLLPLANSNLSVEASKLSASLGSMGAVVGAPGSPTTRLASHPRGTATSWNSVPDTRPTTLPAPMTNSPSPPLTTQSATPVTSATTSPQHIPYEGTPTQQYTSSSPVAVRAAVHRADTGTNNNIRIHITSTRMPSSHKSEGSLEHSPPRLSNNYPSQTQSQNDLDVATAKQKQISPEYTYRSITSLPKRHIWQRSASCRELYDYSFEDSGQAKRRIKPPKSVEAHINLEERKLESPITRYDDHRIIYSSDSRNASLEIHQDIMMPDQKVYSSSYPGTTSYSQESMEDPGNYDLRDSQDDLSHDSYELIERSDDDYSTSGDYKYKKAKTLNTRSCSLDSGNYLPSDTESEGDKRHKCKSSNDLHQDIFNMEDPRDLPREIIPRKSDGSFYKTFKTSSRTSSLESKSDYYESKASKSSKESLKKTAKDRSFGSRTSSQESKSDYDGRRIIPRNKSYESMRKHEFVDSRASSLDSKSEYYDAVSNKTVEENRAMKHPHDYDRKISFQRNYGTIKPRHENMFSEINRNVSNYNSFPTFKETSHVHSISLQNVETEQNIRANRMMASLEQNTVPRTQKPHQRPQSLSDKDSVRNPVTHIWPEPIAGVQTDIRDWKSKQSTRSTESESNVFSFDEDKIQSLVESDGDIGGGFSVVPDIDPRAIKPESKKAKDTFRDIFIEIEPRKLDKGLEFQMHQPIERTKSDPNSLARQRLNSNSRRLPLMHQKTIDLTPAESSDEDYLYKQIPSAPPIMKYRGSHFEMPTAEFGHFDILKREIEGQKTKFEVPKSQFEILGAKTQSDFINLPPKNDADIPYVLHKRHVMNGTASKEEPKSKDSTGKYKESTTKSEAPQGLLKTVDKLEYSQTIDELKLKQKSKPKSPTTTEPEPTFAPPSSFLFTQNIDLSKVDPVTLEVDKSIVPIQHMSSPKRDITRIDPVMLEALNNKLSQIESDSPTSSKTESLKPIQKAKILPKEETKPVVPTKVDQSTQKSDMKNAPKPEIKIKLEKQDTKPKETKPKVPLKDKPKGDGKVKRVIKPRMQPNKKGAKNKTKVRITSFSSDDESLDSDDVFGSAEATPTKLEFSPPQTRKEMESILKIESERKYLQYTMSSTEVEGSPPQIRKTDLLYDRSNDPNFQTELRRISERSFSIPSSEDELNMKTADMQAVFADPIPEPALTPLEEVDREDADKSVDDTIGEQVTVQELLKAEDIKQIEEEKEKEKELLKADIERDLKDLRVPSRTKITEICSPSLRKKGQSPLLFAHARLNLSEGSAFTLLQKQQATESPVPGRRAKSLDAPVISVSRLPPSNAFSSKDDTVEEEDNVCQLFIESSDKEHDDTPRFSELSESDADKPPPAPRRIESYKVQPPKIVKEILKDSEAAKAFKEKEAHREIEAYKEMQAAREMQTNRDGAVQAPKDWSKSGPLPLKPKQTTDVKCQKPELKQKTAIKPKPTDKDKDQIVPDVSSKPKRMIKTSSMTRSSAPRSLSSKGKPPAKSAPGKEATKFSTPKDKPPIKPSLDRRSSTGSKITITTRTPTTKKPEKSTGLQKSSSADRVERLGERLVESDRETPSERMDKSLTSQSSLTLPEIKRTKSQELESTAKRPTPKEKAKSLEKLEFKRTISKERTRSQEESDTDIAKRKEKQQMLYEIAIKQTKTIKSPVKDVLPVFPQVEEMVRERGGKLEISINTIEPSVSLEEAIIITKSPKKLDKKMDKKYTKSLELNLTVDDEAKRFQRLGGSLDLDNRPERETQEFEFDFQMETINNIRNKDAREAEMEETSPESEENMVRELVKADIHKEGGEMSDDNALQETEMNQDNVILEGTSLDVWLSIDEIRKSGSKVEGAKGDSLETEESREELEEGSANAEDDSKIEDITVIRKSANFFEKRSLVKPPDLGKLEAKSSSDSQSMERLSLGNSLDIKYIDDSGDSSHKSEKDTQLIVELQKASDTVEKILLKKIHKQKQSLEELRSPDDLPEDKTLVRITSEDESLTEVSELKPEGRDQDTNFLGVDNPHKDALLKLSIERSRSEDTGSWVTVECEEYAGTESFDYDNAPLESSEKVSGDDRSPAGERFYEGEKMEEDGMEDADLKNYKLENLRYEMNLEDTLFEGAKINDDSYPIESHIEDNRQAVDRQVTDEDGLKEVDIKHAIFLNILEGNNVEQTKIEDSANQSEEDICFKDDRFADDRYKGGRYDHSQHYKALSDYGKNIDQQDGLQYNNTRPQTVTTKPDLIEEAEAAAAAAARKDTEICIPQDEILDSNLLTTDPKSSSKLDLLKRSSDQSRSSDTTGSWTSGEKDLSPGNAKDNEESSVSCSIGRAIGLSQTIEMFATKDFMDKTSPDLDAPRSPRSPRSPRICILGRAFTIDEESGNFIPPDEKEKSDESSSDCGNDFPKDLTPIQENESNEETLEGGVKYKKKPYPFEEKWSNDSELSQRLHQKLSKKISSADKTSLSSMDESCSERRRSARSPLHSVEKLSTESRNSLDTESSSGSLGVATRLTRSGDPIKEPSSTWRPFPLESSGSSSIEEGGLNTDQDFYGQEYFLSRENSGEFAALSDVTYQPKDDDVTPTGDGTNADLAAFTYPALPSIGPSSTDLMPGYGPSFLSRTLSRISERSTNSEKSSIEEDSTKASTQSDSINEESLNSSDRQASLSSDPPSNAHVSDSEKKISTNNGKPSYSIEKKSTSKTSEIQYCEPIPNISNLLQRQISDDRRTSAEMAELSMDDIEIITSERGLRLRRQESEDTIIDEECFESDAQNKKGSSSQDSDEWPLPDIPQQTQKPLMALHETPSSDTSQITTQLTQLYQPPSKSIPKVFGLRGSFKSQDSEQWPSPPSSVTEPPVVGNVETYYMTPPEEAYKVVVDSSTISTYDNDESNSDNENKTLDFDGEKTHTYENVASTEQISESISESLSAGPSGVKIVLETKSGDSGGSNSEEDLNISNLNDDVFTETIDTSSKNELRPPTVLRRSTTSDDSSHSGHKNELRPPSKKSSHSSYSEEECTSSLGTTLEDGTVRYALKPTKCTHSSHSEDTSIALSLSEWSNSTNTVKFQNLSSNSGTTKSSTNTSGLKSDDNSLTDIAQSISEWSSSNSNTLKAQSLQFQKLSSNTSTGDSTLTELLPTISDWSTSDATKTMVPQQFFTNPGSLSTIPDRSSISRLGSSIDDGDLSLLHDQKCIKSPKNIPSEDLALVSVGMPMKDSKLFTKSTERPIIIPVMSDTEKSTESSSMEQRTVHTQRYDREKQKYSQKHQPSSKSTERPVKVPLKLSKCSPYYSSSLSSESTPMQTSSPISLNKTATIPLTRSHRKPVAKHLFQAKSPPSENDSTSSMESPKSKSDSRDRRGYRRRRQAPQKRHKVEKGVHTQDDYFYFQEQEISDYNEYIRNKSMEEVACAFHYESALAESAANYVETLEEGYYPDGDSQSGSDIFRMEREDDDRFEISEGFDVSCIPPPLLEDDFESDRQI